MLVFTRKKGDVVDASGGVEIHFVRRRGSSVRIGIKAPGLAVRRGELSVGAGKPSNKQGLLVLARHQGETIVIDERITIMINKVGRRRIELGLQAPDSVRFKRREAHAA